MFSAEDTIRAQGSAEKRSRARGCLLVFAPYPSVRSDVVGVALVPASTTLTPSRKECHKMTASGFRIGLKAFRPHRLFSSQRSIRVSRFIVVAPQRFVGGSCPRRDELARVLGVATVNALAG